MEISDWLNSKCKEIQFFENRHDSFNHYKKVRQAVGMYRPKTAVRVIDENGDIILQRNLEKIHETLLKDEIYDVHDDNVERSPRILKEEVGKVIRFGKETGPDSVFVDLFKLVDDNIINIIETITLRKST